jgi:hypothetical protein
MTTDNTSADMGDFADQPGQQRRTDQIDVKLLAEKVYRLMLADLRLSQARGERVRRGRERQ